MAGGRASALKIKKTHRRELCLQLRVQGLSYRAISDHLLEAQGLKVSYQTVKRDIAEELEELRKRTAGEAKNLVQLELERLNVAQAAAMVAMSKGDINAINAFVRVSESRRKLLGLDAPIQLMVSEALEAEMAARDAAMISLLESTLDPETFAEVADAAQHLLTASRAAETN